MGDKLKMIPLCQLQRSKINVRKTEPLIKVPQLAESILEKGLLENLVVRPVPKNGHNAMVYEVTAGGRRLAALKLLAKRGSIERKHLVRCLIRNDDDAAAVEVSLSENFIREGLHPADEFEAFSAMVRDGSSVDDVAARFRVTPTFVQQRLKLAAVSPRLVEEYRKCAITLEQLTAFTVSDDHKAQEAVWFDSPYTDLPAPAIRRLLTKANVEGSDRRARFIGVKAYETAGGIIIRDLFDTKDEGYFADSQLLDRLVAEKLDQAAQAVRKEGWLWVEVHGDADYAMLSDFGRVQPAEVLLSKKEEARLSRLCERYDALVSELEDEVNETARAELDWISTEIDGLQAKKLVWTDDLMVQAGAIITLGHDGVLHVIRGLVKGSLKAKAPDGAPEQAAKRKSDSAYSDAVRLELSAQRTAALRECVAAQPGVALTALLCALAGTLLYSESGRSCLHVGATEVFLDRASPAIRESKAGQAFQARHVAWLQRLPERESLWSWVADLDVDGRLDLLAHCVALTVDTLDGPPASLGRLEHSAVLANAVGLDMRAWWRPTQANFFARVSKDGIVAAVAEGASPEVSRRLIGLKKGEMAAEAEKLLAESVWLPAPLRDIRETETIDPQQQ